MDPLSTLSSLLPIMPAAFWQASCKDKFKDLLLKMRTSTAVWPPPTEMPEELKDNFTLGGRVRVTFASPTCVLVSVDGGLLCS